MVDLNSNGGWESKQKNPHDWLGLLMVHHLDLGMLMLQTKPGWVSKGWGARNWSLVSNYSICDRPWILPLAHLGPLEVGDPAKGAGVSGPMPDPKGMTGRPELGMEVKFPRGSYNSLQG